MIRSVLFIEPLEGDVDAIEQFFVSEGVLEHAATIPGFVSAELQLPEDRQAPAMVTALWASREAYRRWVEDPWRAGLAERSGSVFRVIEQPGGGGSLYEVAVAVSAPTSRA